MQTETETEEMAIQSAQISNDNNTFVEEIIQSMVDTLIVLNEDTEIVRTNKIACNTLGYTEEELLGKNFFDIVKTNESSKTSSESIIMLQMFEGGNVALEVSLVTKNNKEIPVALAGSILSGTNRDNAKFVFSAKNMAKMMAVEKQKRVFEKQLAHSAKLASLGTLGAGIAHELNNPLVGVRGYAELILVEKGVDNRISDLARKIIKSSNRMQKIIKHLRSFSADTSDEELENFSINETINNSLTLLKQQLSAYGINVVLQLDPRLPSVYGEANSVESIFQNLLANSRDAFGDLTDDRDKKIVIESELDSGGNINISFRDNAGGIPDEIIKSIFDPFFTTKEVGKGTGLGLSISHGIIKDHNGTINVACEKGEGTTFTIGFPAVKEEEFNIDSPRAVLQNFQSPAKSLKVAIVDDESLILDILDTYLSDEFEITLYNNPIEATVDFLQIEYDIVITDMKMPEINGLQLIRELKDASPSTVAIVITGHAQSKSDIAEAVAAGATGVICKPFSNKQDMIDEIKKYYDLAQASVKVEQKHQVPNPKGGSKKKSILVIDDQEQICEILEIFLSEEYDVTSTHKPNEGIDLIESNCYDMIISDLQMPHISGFDIINKVQTINPDIKTLVMSGNDEKHPDCLKALKLGANRIMMKPFKGKASILEQVKTTFEVTISIGKAS